jgi:hypothetical protein
MDFTQLYQIDIKNGHILIHMNSITTTTTMDFMLMIVLHLGYKMTLFVFN